MDIRGDILRLQEEAKGLRRDMANIREMFHMLMNDTNSLTKIRYTTVKAQILEDRFAALCNQYDVSMEEIRSRRRPKELVEKRAMIAKHLRSLDYSFNMIGAVMNKDHTSVMHLVNNIDVLKVVN